MALVLEAKVLEMYVDNSESCIPSNTHAGNLLIREISSKYSAVAHASLSRNGNTYVKAHGYSEVSSPGVICIERVAADGNHSKARNVGTLFGSPGL